MNIKKQIAKMYSLDFLGAFNLTDSIWLLLLVSRGFSLWEAGLAEGVFHLVSLLCEIPSGMVADLYGRRKALCAGWLVFASASLLMLFSDNIVGVCLAFGLNALGYNLCSGTREALVFDSLRQVGEEERYISVSSWQNFIWRSSGAVSRLMAGVAVLMGFRVCYILHIATSLCGACLSLTLTEAENSKPHDRKSITLQVVADDMLGQGKSMLAFMRGAPLVRAYMLGVSSISGMVALAGFFIQQRLFDIGAGGVSSLGPLLFCVSLGGIAGARLATRVYNLSFRVTFAVSGGFMALGVLLCGLPAVPLCVVGGFTMFLFDEVICTVTEARLNHMFPSEQRASLVSVFSMCFSLSMFVLSPVLGALCGWLGIGRAFAVLAVAMVGCLLCFARAVSTS